MTRQYDPVDDLEDDIEFEGEIVLFDQIIHQNIEPEDIPHFDQSDDLQKD